MPSTPTVLVAGAGVVGLAVGRIARDGPLRRSPARARSRRAAAAALASRRDGRARLCAVARVAAAARARRRVAARRRTRARRRIGACASGKAPDAYAPSALDFDSAEIGEPDLGHIVEDSAAAHRAWPTRSRPRRRRSSSRRRRSSRVDRDGAARSSSRSAKAAACAARVLLAADGSDSAVRRLLDLPAAGHRYEQNGDRHARDERCRRTRTRPGSGSCPADRSRCCRSPTAAARSSGRCRRARPSACSPRATPSSSPSSQAASAGVHRRAHGLLEARRLSAAGFARAALHGAARRAARRRCAHGAPARGSRHELGTS